jgi:hypothetical protein
VFRARSFLQHDPPWREISRTLRRCQYLDGKQKGGLRRPFAILMILSVWLEVEANVYASSERRNEPAYQLLCSANLVSGSRLLEVEVGHSET